MQATRPLPATPAFLLTLALAAPNGAFAYGTEDAIRDCENRIRGEYGLTDLRNPHAVQLDGDKHFKVNGKAKVDGDTYPWNCEIKSRHVTMAEYDGPKAKGLTDAQKIAIGAAAVAIGVAASQANKNQDDTSSSYCSHHGSHGSAAAELQDLIGVKASSGELELEDRGFEYVKGQKSGGMAFTNWIRGSHCVTVRTEGGRYTSIVDVTKLDCE
ncbi:hypothetical protein Thiowin_03113 [Thiorhodovibrio winogradskyi]|uniref:Secreted protein n=1 Tax=Thiorhodovibrio winogradskyi TaxID=77007 RepID=A0ABZ0SB13_9GAMM|nr:hypothetical protein [Thiorhodovibrio winogradskyi]